ncbi:MAG: DUF3810 domain-containing protein [Chitinophagaceae bacterium]|nr:DUF3810 domain-containing protein [Chitinophagaceae bacterium]
MNSKKRAAILLLLVLTVVSIRLFSSNEVMVESYYSTGIYPYISSFLKHLFGWLPFSLGDLIYLGLIVWALVKLFKVMKKLLKKEYTLSYFKTKMYACIVSLLFIYIVFNLLWGINYNRMGITRQLGIKLEKYTTRDLITVDSLLLIKVNESKSSLLINGLSGVSNSETFAAAQKAYSAIADKYPFLEYQPSSIKASIWGWAGNYIGFTGYYNPFTGEAQLNTTVPAFLKPYTSCHEIAHQLGYAKENEANFVGYLAAAASPDTLLHYSVYLDLFLYTQRNLFYADSAMTKSLSEQLLPEVKADLKEWKKFNEAHQSPLEPIFRLLYGMYLENNQQPSGILSYDEVTGFLVAYYKKFGRL